MLSFLQQLGKRSYSAQSMTRSDSSDSALSRTVNRKLSDSNSTVPSLTPPTSHADTASDCPEPKQKHDSHRRSSERLRRVSSSVLTYNENMLAGSSQRKPRKKSETVAGRTVPGETLVNAAPESQDQFAQESLQGLAREWSLGALPGDDLKTSLEETAKPTRRKSTRLDGLEKATRVFEKPKSVLGKRRRETLDGGVETLQSITGGAGLRARRLATSVFEEPKPKKTRSSKALEVTALPNESGQKIVNRARAKRWLGQGLYVGQDRDLDPRLTETKNRLKKSSANSSTARQSALLPLPMFAGQRTLDLGRNFKLPFDVFSPLPPGQPRPEEWKKTHKNVFVGDAANIWKKSKPLESSKCVCAAESGCGEDCFNRFMFYECDSTNCNIGSNHCTNRSFEGLRQRCKDGGRYSIGVEVIKTLDRGHGVRSNRCFEPNQIIVEYTGEIITQEECDDRMHQRYKDSECYYLMDFDQQMILDATRGSIARFINHSCEPNCRMIKWTVAGKPRMALFAGDAGIMTGEELTYDYKFNPYSVKNVQECRCGTPTCRGVLGPKPKEIKDALKSLTTGGKRKFQQALEDSIQTVTKKRKIAIPSSVKNAFASAKVQASKKLAEARILTTSLAQNERLMRKVSTRSLRGVEQATATVDESLDSKVQNSSTATITSPRRRSMAGTFLKADSRGAAAARPRSVSKKDEFRAKASSKRKNVVRTVRRSSRVSSGGGKSIRVISDHGIE